jgi:hypothetical protein
MRKSVLAALAAGALALTAGATSANAASVVTGVTPSSLAPPASALFGATVTGTAGTDTAINDSFTFNLMNGPALTDSQVSTILLGANDIDFTSITLDSVYAFMQTSFDPGTETWALMPGVVLNDGMHTIHVVGTLHGVTGSYSGTLNVAAVPEPATWAMMLLGFGAMGVVFRRRRQPVLAQIA